MKTNSGYWGATGQGKRVDVNSESSRPSHTTQRGNLEAALIDAIFSLRTVFL